MDTGKQWKEDIFSRNLKNPMTARSEIFLPEWMEYIMHSLTRCRYLVDRSQQHTTP